MALGITVDPFRSFVFLLVTVPPFQTVKSCFFSFPYSTLHCGSDREVDCHVGESCWPVHSCETSVYSLWQGAKTVSTDLTRGLIRSRWICSRKLKAVSVRMQRGHMWVLLNKQMSTIYPPLLHAILTHTCDCTVWPKCGISISFHTFKIHKHSSHYCFNPQAKTSCSLGNTS